MATGSFTIKVQEFNHPMQPDSRDKTSTVSQSIQIAPWRSPLARALHRNRSLPHARYFQLATVDAQGRPDNRTVVFRGFVEQSNDLKMVIDGRSRKIEQIQHQSWAAICWYFPNTREQFRISGALTLVDSSASNPQHRQVYEQTWQALSSAARQQFYWPMPNQLRTTETVELPSVENLEPPSPNYCLLICTPEQVDHLVLQGEPHQRYQYERDTLGNWQTHWVMP
jgi:pyridoxamine 5'-phosphate oxidase